MLWQRYAASLRQLRRLSSPGSLKRQLHCISEHRDWLKVASAVLISLSLKGGVKHSYTVNASVDFPGKRNVQNTCLESRDNSLLARL